MEDMCQTSPKGRGMQVDGMLVSCVIMSGSSIV